ncbi:MAG: septum formation initiator family protein [Clostridia bacterium]|nr:septum formation initiator family protein [Clostridia bacterium]
MSEERNNIAADQAASQKVEDFETKKAADETKFQRIVVAFTVGAVILLAVLIMLMCYQLINIGGKRRQIAELKTQIAAYEKALATGEETLEIRQQRWYIERRARELGYSYSDDIVSD